jgi:hypothetical protein
MEKIYFDEKTYIWKDVFDITHIKNDVLKECIQIINYMEKHISTDNYGLFNKRKKNIDINEKFEIYTKIDEILNAGINACTLLFNQNVGKRYNKINIDGWINIVRATNPKQPGFEIKDNIVMHSHTDLNQKTNSFVPTYTYVHYIQMPDNLEGNDGVLYLEGKDGIIHNILPKENDIIIMNGNLPHTPNTARKSTKDRIVIAGNVGFECIKKNKTLI